MELETRHNLTKRSTIFHACLLNPTDESSLYSNRTTTATALHSSNDPTASHDLGVGEDAGEARSGGCGCNDNNMLLLAAGALAFAVLNMQLQQIITLLTGGGKRRKKREEEEEEDSKHVDGIKGN